MTTDTFEPKYTFHPAVRAAAKAARIDLKDGVSVQSASIRGVSVNFNPVNAIGNGGIGFALASDERVSVLPLEGGKWQVSTAPGTMQVVNGASEILALLPPQLHDVGARMFSDLGAAA